MRPKPRFSSIDCIKCDFKIKLLDPLDTIPEGKWDPVSQMWDGGSVGLMEAGYGSILDGFSVYIGICDSCTKNNLECGSLIYWRNYIGEDDETKSRFSKILNRKNNLDHLLG